MQLGIFAKTFAGDEPMAVFSAARDAGYDVVQYNFACSGLSALPTAIPIAAIAAIREASEATGVQVAAVSATYNMIHPDPSVRQAGRAAFAAIADATHLLGAQIVTICTGSRDPDDQWRHHPGNRTPEAWEEFITELRLLLKVAEARRVTVAVEPEPGNVVHGPERARAMLDLLDHPNLGIVLDPANLFESSEDFRNGVVVNEAASMLADRIVMAHAKDRSAAGSVVPAGEGLVDFPGFLAHLRDSGFNGPIVTHGLLPDQAKQVARRLRAAMGAP